MPKPKMWLRSPKNWECYIKRTVFTEFERRSDREIKRGIKAPEMDRLAEKWGRRPVNNPLVQNLGHVIVATTIKGQGFNKKLSAQKYTRLTGLLHSLFRVSISRSRAGLENKSREEPARKVIEERITREIASIVGDKEVRALLHAFGQHLDSAGQIIARMNNQS